MWRRVILLVVVATPLMVPGGAAAGAAAAAPPATGTGTPFLVGAATVDITPPLFDDAADRAAFPTCPTSVFAGPRVFALQEPYTDMDGDGEFHYPEPYCDANGNGRYDGLYLSGATDHIARRVHDPIDARAIAIGDGTTTAVLVSVVSQGLFETYTHPIRDRARELRPGITDVIVSSNHNESSPDPIGIYGAPDLDGELPVGLHSGIDDYYIAFLVERVAQAAVAAYDDRRPASLRATTFTLPANLTVRLSHNFPTTDDQAAPAAIDPKVRVLQAVDRRGRPIVTLMNLAAHNQQIGHNDDLAWEISSDWPGYFHDRLETLTGGEAVFLVGANGSEEDPETVPPAPCEPDCYAQAQATGEALAATVAEHLPMATRLRTGAVRITRDEFFVPLENNLFKAAAAGGLFGNRQGYVDGVPVGPGLGTEFRTEVGLLTIGPDLQLLANPAESFPALIFGSPWGIEDAPCADRPNPPVPNWFATARFRFQAGLADDLIGYIMPAWAFASIPGTYTTDCTTDPDTDKDSKGHQHKLEDESVGPTAGNLVAEHLTALLGQDGPPTAAVVHGRFVLADGTITRRPAGRVTAVLLDGGQRVRVRTPIDFDGQPQPEADVTTRGVVTASGQVLFLDVYPLLAP